MVIYFLYKDSNNYENKIKHVEIEINIKSVRKFVHLSANVLTLFYKISVALIS